MVLVCTGLEKLKDVFSFSFIIFVRFCIFPIVCANFMVYGEGEKQQFCLFSHSDPKPSTSPFI